ncbi:hypothetical protein KSS87_009497, partial [Heliosperma pusillum]
MRNRFASQGKCKDKHLPTHINNVSRHILNTPRLTTRGEPNIKMHGSKTQNPPSNCHDRFQIP